MHGHVYDRGDEPGDDEARDIAAGQDVGDVGDMSAGVSSDRLNFITEPAVCVVPGCPQPVSDTRRAAGYRTCAAHYREEPHP